MLHPATVLQASFARYVARYNLRVTIVTSQLPIAHWHEAVGDPTLADVILNRGA